MTAEWQLITKKIADQILARPVVNRTISDTYSRRLALDMELGGYVPNHQALALNPDGGCGDGRHRLTGVSVSDIPQWFLVVQYHDWDEYRAAINVADQGRIRSFGDSQEILGTIPDRGRDRDAVAKFLHFVLTSQGAQASLLQRQNYLIEQRPAYDEVSRYLTKKSPVYIRAAFVWLQPWFPEEIINSAHAIQTKEMSGAVSGLFNTFDRVITKKYRREHAFRVTAGWLLAIVTGREKPLFGAGVSLEKLRAAPDAARSLFQAAA